MGNNQDNLAEIERLRSIIEHSQQGIFLLNKNLEIIFFNKTFQTIIGYPREEIQSQNFNKFLAEKSKKRIKEYQINKKTTPNIASNYELNCVQKNGTIRRVAITTTPYIDYDETNPATTLAQLVDITDTYNILSDLKQTKDDYLNLFQNVNDAIIVFYPEDNTILDCNKKAIELYGFNKEELIGKSLEILSENTERGNIKISEVLEKGTISNYETIHHNKTGEEIYLEISAKTITYQNGTAILSINHDITRRKKQEKTQQFLLDVSKISYHEISLTSYLKKIHNELKKILKADNFYIALYDKTNNQYQFPYHIDEFYHLDDNQTLTLNSSLTDYVLTSGKAQIIDNAAKTKLQNKGLMLNRGASSAIWLGAPLMDSKNDTPIGVITIQDYHDPKAYSIEDLHTLEFIANHIGLFVDRAKNIEELKKTKELAEEGRLRYQSLFKDNDSVMLIIDPDTGNIVDANESACSFYGYSIQEITNLKITQINTLSKAEIEVEIENAKHKRKKHFNFNHRLANGEIKQVQVYSGQINQDGQSFLYSIVHDISKRYKVENALRKSEAKFRMLFENAPLGIYIAFPSGQIIDSNASLLAILGSPSHKATKQINVKTFPALKSKGYSKAFEDCIESGENQKMSMLYTSKWGQKKWISSHIIPIKNTLNKVTSVFTIMEDITAQKNSEIEIIKAKEKAEESDHLKSAFLANMSHEIRTPMNGILGFTDLLQDPDLSGEQQQQYIDIIQKSGDRMLDTVNDIIEISKIETDQIDINISTLNINNQIEYYYNFFKPEAEKKGLNISFNNTLTTSKSTIKTDRAKFDSILNNLIKNAIKYTKEGSIEIGYQLLEKEQQKHLQFHIKDTGIGVPIDRQDAIFNRFIQADVEDKRASQGVGLGLAITKAYVNMLGGNIWLESEENEGSVFYFTLPFIVPENINQPTIPIKEEKYEFASNKKLKILIAEDNYSAFKYLTIILKNITYEIIHATNGSEAVEKCKQHSDIDLILMDIQMPNMNGHEATREIRKFNTEIIIIAQTAFALEGDKEKALEAGCNDYITKPIKKEILIQKIHDLKKY